MGDIVPRSCTQRIRGEAPAHRSAVSETDSWLNKRSPSWCVLHPAGRGLAYRPVGAWRRHLVKRTHSICGRRSGLNLFWRPSGRTRKSHLAGKVHHLRSQEMSVTAGKLWGNLWARWSPIVRSADPHAHSSIRNGPMCANDGAVRRATPGGVSDGAVTAPQRIAAARQRSTCTSARPPGYRTSTLRMPWSLARLRTR